MNSRSLFLILSLFINFTISFPSFADRTENDVEHKGVSYIEKVIINGGNLDGRTLTVTNYGTLRLFEGDINIGDEVQSRNTGFATIQSVSRTSIDGVRYRWGNNTIPYVISNSFSSADRSIILTAINDISNKTNLEFIERTLGNSNLYNDYVAIDNDQSGCFSYVGRQGGVQKINLAPGCVFHGIVIHEILHAAGLWHEQSREDRNNYIKINFSNIKKGVENNFEQHIYEGDDLGFYDYDSIMHYGAFYFADNKSIPTIIPLDSSKTIGQRRYLSQGDINGINSIYPEFKPIASINRAPSFLKGETITLDASQSYDPNGEVLNFTWEIIELAETYRTQSPIFQYSNILDVGNYTFKLTVDDGKNQSTPERITIYVYAIENVLPIIMSFLLDDDAIIKKVGDININPTANINIIENSNNKIIVDSSSSYDIDGSIIESIWKLSDGRSFTGSSNEINFYTSGSYNLILTVKDDRGATNQQTLALSVQIIEEKEDWNRIMNWAESFYPDVFDNRNVQNMTINPYKVRYYKGSKTYLGFNPIDDRFYGYNLAMWGDKIIKFGTIDEYIDGAIQDGF